MRNAADVTGSLLTAVLVFAAIPTALILVIGDPLAHGLGHGLHQPVRDLLAVLTATAWLAWAACSLQLARAVIVHVRLGGAVGPSGAALTDRVAARIATGVLIVIALGGPLTLTSAAGASRAVGTSITARDVIPASAPAQTSLVPGTDAPLSSATTYVVRSGDSLWSIADAELGAGDDWPSIAALNLGRLMPGGLRMLDPNRIYAGWTLQMPTTAAPVATRDAAAVVAPPSDPHARTEGVGGAASPVLLPLSGDAAPSFAVASPGPSGLTLPELVALGIGTITCAALARRARRGRLLRQAVGGDPTQEAAPSERAVDTAVLLARFADAPALGAFESANYTLAEALARDGRQDLVGGFRAICVGAAGVDFWLAEPGQPAPAGFTLSADAGMWHLAHGAGSSVQAGRPFLPIVLPIGDDDAGTWLVPLRRGSCLPIMGDAAESLWRAARPAQEAWSWADSVLVTDDPLTVADEVGLSAGAHDRTSDAPQILYFGDPAFLGDPLAQQVAIVTLAHVPASDVTVLVDAHAASIHPLGRTLRPHLMDDDTAHLIEQLITPRSVAGQQVADLPPMTQNAAPPRSTSFVEVDPAAAAAFPPPGTVEVKLLTMTPRLDGLREDLPPNRMRRAVELVAYLGLHIGEDVTSDRLRTRVLGSADADAASKTLFNIAAAARRALGADRSGVPLFPPGTRTGHYRVTEEVTVDVHRAASLALQGSGTEDPTTAIALLRAALELVEGEPLANALSGYSWWEAEGHGARIAAVLVNAAGNLAALAVEAGLFELAQWGLDQARLVDPYSEALSRSAMQVAAAAGDADRLRREWRACQRRMDELDPGATPSPRTERLYGELRQANFAAIDEAPRKTRPSAPVAL